MSKKVLAVAAVGCSCSMATADIVGYWNFNNMTTVLPPSQSDGATPGIASSAPGPLGLVSRNTFTNMGSPGPAYEGFRADFNFGGSYAAVPPNHLNALNGDADIFGLRLGNGSEEFNRNGQSVWFPLSSLETLSGLQMSFAMYAPTGHTYTTARVFWNTSMSTSGWHLVSTFTPQGSPWGLVGVDFGAQVDGIQTPWVALQLDGGSTFVNTIVDNVQFNAVPAPTTLVAFTLLLAAPSRRRPASRVSRDDPVRLDRGPKQR